MSHLMIERANALSSPYSIGFPAITSWLGFVHALQLKINQRKSFKDVLFSKTGVVVHELVVNRYRDKPYSRYSLFLSKLPGLKNGVGAKVPPICEEAKCDIDATVLIEVDNLAPSEFDELIELAKKLIMKMKVVSGDMTSVDTIQIRNIIDDKDIKCLAGFLMPGFFIKDRTDLMDVSKSRGLDAIDGILEYCSINKIKNIETNKDGKESISYQFTRKYQDGWLVPIAVGFHGISKPDKLNNQRNELYQHRFAESVVSIGEFVMTYRLSSINEIMWEHKYVESDDMYLCVQYKTKQVNNNG